MKFLEVQNMPNINSFIQNTAYSHTVYRAAL